jgi:hypothetical protein
MSESKPTPGPWYVSQVGLTNGGERPITTEDGRICTVDCQTPFKRGEGWQSECEVREANARLIAAAPDLLDAAKDALWALDNAAAILSVQGLESTLSDPRIALRAAIAKASGGVL